MHNRREIKLVFVFTILVFIGASLCSQVFCSDDPRNYINGLKKNSETHSDDYFQPYLIAQTAIKLPFPREAVITELREMLKKGRIDLKTQFSLKGKALKDFSLGSLTLPNESFTGKQLEGINECTIKKCLVKLNIEKETKALQESSNKSASFRTFIYDRIVNYVKKGELLAYEERATNHKQVVEMLDLFQSLGSYPNTRQFLKNYYASPRKTEKPTLTPKDAWLRQELAVIAPDRMQPIMRISEDLEFEENKAQVFYELQLYTNHYFDSSSTLYEITASDSDLQNTVVAVTDIMEVDELKKSALIRTLFKGKMVQAVQKYQDETLSTLSSTLRGSKEESQPYFGIGTK